MKEFCRRLLTFVLVFSLLPAGPVYAIGDGNINNGGGSMGQGTTKNSWSPGNEGG